LSKTRPKYKNKFIAPYELPRLFDADGDMKKDWYVFYKYNRPDGKGKERFRIRELDGVGSLNRIKDKEQRYYVAGIMISAITELLESGYNPFIESNKQGEEFRGESDLILSDAIEKYLEVKVGSSAIRGETATNHRSLINIFKAYAKKKGLLDKRMVDLTQSDYQGFFDHRLSVDKVSGATHNSDLSRLGTFVKFFEGRIEGFSNKLKVKSAPESGTVHRVYTQVERERIVSHLKNSDPTLLFYVLHIFYVCLRPKEGRRLRVGDYNVETRKISINSEQSKGKSAATFTITDGLLPVVQAMELHRYPKHWYVFGKLGQPSAEPCAKNYFSERYRQVMDVLGFGHDYTMYGWKHTRNVDLYLQYKDPYKNMRFNRHKNLQTTMKYLKELGLFTTDTIENDPIYF